MLNIILDIYKMKFSFSLVYKIFKILIFLTKLCLNFIQFCNKNISFTKTIYFVIHAGLKDSHRLIQ